MIMSFNLIFECRQIKIEKAINGQKTLQDL